jgi:manganese-dependent inorganic pyrophosphatase
MIKVFGHYSPDTDSTGSPLIWAWYLSDIKHTPPRPCYWAPPIPKQNSCWNIGGLRSRVSCNDVDRRRACRDRGHQQPR